MVVPMKCTVLFLRFIKGPNVKDWVCRWTQWIINELNMGQNPMDNFYWEQVTWAFTQAFQDTGTREQAEDKLRHLTFNGVDVDTFIVQFETLLWKPHTRLMPNLLYPYSHPNFLIPWWTTSIRLSAQTTLGDGPMEFVNGIKIILQSRTYEEFMKIATHKRK